MTNYGEIESQVKHPLTMLISGDFFPSHLTGNDGMEPLGVLSQVMELLEQGEESKRPWGFHIARNLN